MAYSIVLPDGVVVDNIPDEVQPSDAKARIIAQYPQYGEKNTSALASGFASYAPQLQETYGGIKTLLGVGAERMGLQDTSKALIESGGKSMKEAQSKQVPLATPERTSFTSALDKGVGSVLTEWLPYQAGSGAANALEALAVSGAGAMIGSAAPGLGTAAGAVTGLVARKLAKEGLKETAEQILQERGEAAAKEYVEQATKRATLELAQKTGAAAALGGQAAFYGAGQTTGRAVSEAERLGGSATDIELSRVLPAAAVSTLAEFIGDKLTLGALKGVGKASPNLVTNIAKQIAVLGTKEAPVEVIQSAAERFGAKLSLADAEAVKEYIDSAASAYAMSTVPGTVGGVRGYQKPEAELVGGQQPGETLRQAAERTQQEIFDLQAMQAEQALAEQQVAQTGIASMLAGPEGRQATRSVAKSPAAFNSLLAQTAEVAPEDQGIQSILAAAASNSRSASQSPAEFNSLLAQTALEEPSAVSGIASVLAAPETRAVPSRVSGPAAFDTLLAPDVPAPAPVAPPAPEAGIASILAALEGSSGRAQSPSVASNLLASVVPPEAPPTAEPGLSNILEAIGRPAASRVQGPSSVNNLLAPEQPRAPITQDDIAQAAAPAVVPATTGAGVPVAGTPIDTATAGVGEPEQQGVGVPVRDAQRPAGRKVAPPVAVAPIAPERGLLFNSPALTQEQHNVVDSISALPEHAPTLQAINSNLGRLTTFLNSQGESVAGPVQSKNPLVKEAKSIYQSLIKTGAEYSSKALGANQNPTPAATKAVAALQQQVAKETSAQSKPEQFFKKLEQQPKKSLAAGVAADEAEVPAAEGQDESLNAQIAAKTEQLEKILVKLMSSMGLREVGLKLVANMKAEGEYANQLITLALNVDSPVRVLRHESIHAMKSLGLFSEKQWETLRKEADTKWIKQFLGEGKDSRFEQYQKLFKEQNLSDADAHEAMIEEAIADAFGQFDLRGAPSGLMSAILKRMQNMFAAIRSVFGGTETAEQILEKAEQGKLKAKAAPAEAGEAKPSLRRAAVPGETEISTQNPQGVTRKYDPIEQMLSIDQSAVEEAMEANPDMYNAITGAILRYGFIPVDTKPADAINVFKKNIVNNLLFLHDAVPAGIRNRSKLWYDGAFKIATELGKQYDMTMEQVAGILAAMSPQKDWFQNVSMGERAIDILNKQGNKSWDTDMLRYARSYILEADNRKEREKRQIFFDKYIAPANKSQIPLKDMDIKTAAAFVRAFDEAYNSRQYRIVTPEGGFGDLVRNNDGKPSTMMWSTYGPIEKAVSIFRDSSRENISQQLGEEHKIRSFYNNIAAPNSDLDHVTIDTHAVAAGLFEALAGTDQPVIENFGGTGKSSVLGVGGTYGIIADAYREAAAQRGVRAREMQSITWEAVRGLFTEEIKSGIKPKVRAEWDKYRAGEQSFSEARNAIIEIAGGIRNPDWVDSGPGQTVSEGAASYDKAFKPEGGVRLREEKDLREKVTFNLSAVTSTIPGLRELYQKAMSGDKGAYAALQKAAESSLKYLLSGTSAKVKVEYAKGVFLSDKEPSLSVSAAFKENDRRDVLAALERFASNYNQEQIHVRQPTAYKVGHTFDDNSYATPVYAIDLAKDLSNQEIDEIIAKSGLIAFTIAPTTTKAGTVNQLIAYWCKQNDQSPQEQSDDFTQFKSKVTTAQQLAGVSGARPKQTVERLYAYGRGATATHGYERIKGDVSPKQGSDTATPRIIADYLLGAEGTTFPPKRLTKFQAASQRLLSDVFEALPVNDLKKPIVRKAYNALNSELVRQFEVLPVKVEVVESTTEPYANSAAMRADVSQNNRLKVYKTQADTFGPEGVPMGDHPLLEESGLVDSKGTPLLYNDLLRAVHDYYAHGVTPAEFGPTGEASAWLNHMASTMSPLARWAITAETRAQNAWTNFRPGAEEMLLKDRGFSLQKAALPPVQFALTGDATVDAPMIEFITTLTPKQALGSLPAKSPLVAKVGASTAAKFSIRAPNTKEFKQWFGDSKIVDENGEPKVMFHGTARDITSFRAKQAGAIFVTDQPGFAETFADTSADWMSKNPEEFFTKEEIAAAKLEAIKSLKASKKGLPATSKNFLDNVIALLQRSARNMTGIADEAIAYLEGKETASKDVIEYAKEELKNQFINKLPTGQNIMPVFVKAENPFDYDNRDDVNAILGELKNFYDSKGNNYATKYERDIEAGNWEVIESPTVQAAIKKAGFDGFYVSENFVKNLAVYDPTQIKSAIGNVGTFEPTSPDIRKSLRSEGVGYHAGDLGYGKDTTLGRMIGGRSTGHFGTGTYFTGNKDQLGGYAENRPVREVSLAGYNLARPKDADNAKRLHDGLRIVNDLTTAKNLSSPRAKEELRKAAFDIWLSLLPRGITIEMLEETLIPESIQQVAPQVDKLFAKSTYAESASTVLMRRLGYEGVDVRHIPTYDNTDYGTVVYGEKFQEQLPEVKASLRSTLPRAIVQRIDQTTTAREDKGFIGRMLQAISPGSHTSIRAELLNRYDALSEIDRLRIKQMGGAAAMADIASESAALMSDLGAGITASALGVHDKVGGAPVYVQSFYVVRNGKILPRRYKTRAQAQAIAGATGEVRSGGHTTVSNFNNAVKGPLAIFAPLAKYNDPMIYQTYQFWAAAKRGKRFDAQGKEQLFTAQDQQHMNVLSKRFPEFDGIQKEWIKYNDKLVQYMVDTGVLTPEKGKIYTQHCDYLPFYRQMEGEATAGPKVFAAISGVKGPKALKGSKAALDDFLETIVRNTQSAVQAGVKNIAAQRAVEAAQDVGLAVKLPAGNGLPSTVTVLENGVPTHYDCKDALFVNALKSLAMSDIPFLNILAMPANLLRAAVTKEPTFMLANMLRDSMSAYVTSGVNMTPVIDTAKNFAKTIAGMSPEFDALRKAGISGGYEFTQGVETSGRKFGDQLKALAGVKATGAKRLGQLAASPVTGVWNLLEKGSEASDAATRQEIYKKTLAETGNETEALFRSLEVMNFNRKGRNAGVRLFTAMIPFLNARMQGLDILYRAAIRPSLLGQSVTAREKELQHTFLVRGATMAGLSAMYWFLTSDDEEYEKQEQETKDNYWLIPSLGIKIPIPFEVGVLFKVIPERIMALAFGDDTFKDFRESMTNQIISTLKVNPIPQAVIPLIENLTNYSFYTTRAIVSPGVEGLEPGYQVSPNTSAVIADLGKALNISPIKLEHAIQGYTGSMGMYLVSAIDAVYDANSTTPRPSKRFEQLPLIKRFALDPEARGTVTSFYKLKDAVDIAVKTANTLERTGNFEEYEKYMDENMNLLASKEYINQLADTMKEMAEMKALIRLSEESGDVKKEALLEIQQMENQLTENIKELQQLAYATD